MDDLNQHRGAPKEQVEAMFDSISHRYDLLNRLLSAGTDRRWRRKAIDIIGPRARGGRVLDVATGTGDLAIEALRLEPSLVTGIDISNGMLEKGREKIMKMGLESRVELIEGDSAAIPFPDGTFSVAMAAFGVRNFENTLRGLAEMNRVLRPGGMIMVLEFSRPAAFPLRQLYGFYFTRILPFIGRIISGDRGAYKYLPDSVMSFPDNRDFLNLLRQAGFEKEAQKRLSGGIASIYTAFRPVG